MHRPARVTPDHSDRPSASPLSRRLFFLAKDPNPITAVILRDHAPDLRFRPGGAVGGLVGPAQAKWLHPSGGNATGSIATTCCSSGLTGWTSDRCQAALMALVIVSTE